MMLRAGGSASPEAEADVGVDDGIDRFTVEMMGMPARGKGHVFFFFFFGPW